MCLSSTMAMGTISLQISSFRCVLRPQFCYSTSATPPTTTRTTATTTTTRTRDGPVSSAPDSLSILANFLVDSLEFSKKQALSTSTKLTKLKQSRGVTQPEILDRGLNSTVRPAIEALREVMGSNENVVRVIKKFRAKSWWAVSKRLAVNVSLLRAQGIPLESIQKRMISNPEPFMWKHEVFKSIMARAEVKWGVSPRSKMFIYAVYLLGYLNSKTIESKCRVFQSFGWDRSHVVSLFRRNPCCFWLAGKNIKAKLRFYMNELGYDPDHIIAHHAVLCYSLEKRVMPRYLVFQLLEDKGLDRKNLAFFTVLAFPEGKFLSKCILPFLDVVPDLHDTYVNSIEAATKDQTTPEKNEIEA